jgi:channel protein (hemolysin III family)
MSYVVYDIASRILQVLDHVGIYMMIAGTFTPILLVALHR